MEESILSQKMTELTTTTTTMNDVIIKNIFDVVENVEYSYEYAQNISRHPNSVDITFDNKMFIIFIY